MEASDAVVHPRRSAFAAAFLSFIFPGLGHAYLGRWLRALLWATLPILAIVAGVGLAISPDRGEYLTSIVDPDVLVGVLAFIVFDLVYRLTALLDAYRLARDSSTGSAGTRVLSTAGLLVILLVLIASHVAVARPVYLAYDTLSAIGANSGDDTPIPELDELGEDFDFLRATPTPEPVASIGVASTPRPTLTPTAEPEPTASPSVGPGWDGKARLNILLIGADGGRQGPASYLTDTMIVVSIDPKTGRVAFISLPRDTAGIPLPRNWGAYRQYGGKFSGKINTLYTTARYQPSLFPGDNKQRGYRALMGALAELYGIKIDYYVAVDLNSFRRTVNTLGGVVVDVQAPVQDTGYPTADGRGKLKLYVSPGMQYMNGQKALAYARSRHGSSDFNRSARQQRIITSLRDQTDLASLFAPGVIDKLMKSVKKHVKTNIPPKLVPKLVSLARDVDLDRRQTLVLSGGRYSEVCFPCPPNGQWVLKANPGAIKSAVQGIFKGNVKAAKTVQKIRDEGAIVHVLNGAGGTNTKTTRIATRLAALGMDAAVPPVADGKADNDEYRKTVITIYNDAQELMPETIKKIKRALKNHELVEVDDPDQEADVIVTVGKRTKTI
jgi:LCP family protein required for cell wall assembly